MALIWIVLLLSISFAAEVDIDSDFLERESSGRIFAYGNVVAKFKNYIINADTVVYDVKAGEVYAFGNLKLKSLDESLQLEAQEAFFDTLREEGFLTFASGRINTVYVNASFLKASANEIDLSDASITTCPPDRRELFLCIQRAKLSQRYAYLGPSTLKFFNQSVFYLPGFILPVGERRSGLLPPEIGSDSDSRFIYRQGVYFVFGQNKDATIGLDVRSSGIKGLNFEYRQAIKKSNDFLFNLSLFKEPDIRTYRERRVENRYRFKLSLDLDNINLKLDFVSDRDFLRDYAKGDEKTAPYIESFFSFSRYFGNSIVYLDFRHFYDTTSKNSSILQRLPEAGVYLPSHKLFKDTYFSLRSSFTNFYRKEGTNTQRLLLMPKLTHQKKLGDNFILVTDFGLGGIYYLNPSSFVTSLDFSNTFRTFLNWEFEKNKLELSASARYSYIDIKGEALGFDLFDRLKDENSAELSLDLKAFRNNEQKLSANIKTSGRVGGNLTPLRGVIEINPFSWLVASYEKTLDDKAQEGEFSSLRVFGKNLEAKITHSVVRKGAGKNEQLRFDLSFRGESIDLEIGFIRDIFARKDTLKSLQISYKGGCWQIGTLLRESFEGQRRLREAFLSLSIFDLRGIKLPVFR